MRILFFLLILPYCNLLAQMSNNQLVISFKNSCNLDASFVTAKSMVIAKEQLMELIYDDEIDFIGFKKNKINEKIKIASIENFVVIRHYINFMDFNDYVFQKDDSLLIEYKNKLPIISVLNRKTNKNDFDSEDLYRKRFKFDGYSPIGKYFEALNLFARKLFDDPLMMKSQSKLTRQQIGLRNATGVTA